MLKGFEQLNSYAESSEYPIVYIPKFREYGISLQDGGNSFVHLNYCPFTGKKIPASLRDAWFDRLEELGFDDPSSQAVPEEYKTEAWWLHTLYEDT